MIDIHSLNLKRIGNYYIGPCPLCGGKDRFTLKMRNDGNYVWHCRKCGDGKYHELFWLEYRMTGKVDKSSLPAKQKKEEVKYVKPDKEWQDKAIDIIYQSNRNLILQSDKNAEICAKYLEERAISFATINIFLLGATSIGETPAIVIPCFIDEYSVWGVKYRLIGADTRYLSLKGSRVFPYGLNAAKARKKYLFITEGEINAMSIHQAFHDVANVISSGSENYVSVLPILKTISRQYEKVFVWFDDIEKSESLSDHIESKIMCSKIVDGVKYDANELLKKGILRQSLENIINLGG